MTDKIAVVERWLEALNDGDVATLASLSSADIEIVGPRSSGFGRPLVRQWAERARMTAVPLRWFSGAGSTVVALCEATWHDTDGRPTDTLQVAMMFEVDRRKVACLARYPELERALVTARLHRTDEVVHQAA
ncbi:MAG: hypothetical protein Q7T56_16180 [Nocardioidaceae bacterium]|nr:hypothetical protein [Nocardioidaceae bacterium]